MSYIVSNQIECLVCGDKPFSMHRHHYAACECGAVAADGGQDYLRRTGSEYKELAIILPQNVVDTCSAYATDSMESGRNGLGVALAVLRAIRDAGFKVTEEIE